MSRVNWDFVDKNDFWKMADALQESTIGHAQGLFHFAETAKPEDLLAILIQYRFFTIYYIPDLAILIARLPDGRLRSFLADILSDELGYGDTAKAHPRLYDDFLASLDLNVDELDELAIRDNIALLDDARRKLLDGQLSSAYGIGLRGMGGECVCQVYLATFYQHFIKNPFIRDVEDKIDWHFWDLHVGEHDIEHRLKTRQLIDEELVQRGAEDLTELGRGYQHSMFSWRAFWDNIFTSVKQNSIDRARVCRAANFQMPLSV